MHSPANGNRQSHSLRRAVTLLLIIMMVSVQTPAAPQVITGVVADYQLGATLWLRSSGWAARLKSLANDRRAPEARAQERQSDRDARVSRIQIYPGDVEAAEGERVYFTAVAYDHDGSPIGGVNFRWQEQDEGRNRRAFVRPTGEFIARNEGNFKVAVEGGGRSAHVSVRVRADKARRTKEQPEKLKNISTDDLPKDKSAAATASPTRTPARPQRAQTPAPRAGAFVKASFAHAANPPATAAAAAVLAPPDDEYGWNSGNFMYARNPDNERGERPGRPIDDGAGSGNFQLGASVLSLAGRGIGLTLGLAYNSRVWTKAGNNITFDADRDWPAPGWSVGFGKIVGMGLGGSLIIDPDGSRHGFKSDNLLHTPSTGVVTMDAHTNDGSFINYSTYSNNTGIRSGSSKLSNGTTIEYGAPGNGAVYPTRITDPNGNYINITYRSNAGPQLDVVTDTLGRTVKFHYDSNNLLTAVTAPGFGDGAPARTLVRLHYQQKTLQYNNFNLTTHVRYPNDVVWLLDAIYYPGTSTGYWFGDGDSYSSYGMLAKVTEQRGMSFSGASPSDTAPTEMGTVTQGVMTRRQSYNYPLTPNQGVYLADAPTYNTLTERWVNDDSNNSQAITETTTTYEVDKTATNPNFPSIPSRKITITRGSDGVKSIQYAYNYTSLPESDANKFKDGLIYQDETRDANNNLLQGSTGMEWQQGAYESPRPVRTEVIDERGQKTAAEFSYESVYNLVKEVRDYDYGGTSLLRVTKTEYEIGAGYVGRHIFNLVKKVEVFAANGTAATTRESLVAYEYDAATLADTPNVTMHLETFNPNAPSYEEPCDCYWEYNQWNYEEYVCHSMCQVSVYNPATAYRGNVTKITRYADAAAASGAIIETRGFDITGNLRTASSSCCELTTINYTANTQYANAESQTRGAASDQTKQIGASAVYDFNTGLVTSGTDANGRLAQTLYYPATLRPQTVYEPKAVASAASAYTSYIYDEAAMSITETTYTAGNQIATQNVKRLNGNGQVRREEAKAEGVNAWDAVETQYDDQGRVSKQSTPFRAGSEQPRETTTHYDVMGRVIKVEAPDGSFSETFYNESNYPANATQNAPGQTTRVRDAWGRERWGRTDVSGRLAEVVEPNPQGSGGVNEGGSLLTAYSYDTLGNLTNTMQDGQTRSFRYDSLGRLLRQKLAEAGATIDDGGNYVGAGSPGALWSDAFAYDERSNLVARTDARGIVTALSYRDAANNLDPLNRLQSVAYNRPANSIIPASAGVSYTYEPGGDKTRLKSVVTAGVSTDNYSYDSEFRVSTRELKLEGRTAYPFRTDYTYDTLDRVTDITYPAQYGVANAPRKVVHQDYDAASRMNGLTVGGASYASQVNYNAGSQTTSLKLGDGVNQLTEKYDYDSVTGLLNGQKVFRGSETTANTLLNLSYDYLRSGTLSGRTGQLTAIGDNRDHKKDHGYEYDALGRLNRATAGGTTGSWAQRYLYDRSGNRSHVLSVRSDGFVVNLYQVTLNRTPDAAEVEAWNSNLRQAYAQGQAQLLTAAKNTVVGFLDSTEYTNRNRTDHEYVSDLYQAYLNRAPDTAGWNAWTAVVATQGRVSVRQGFADSGEFSNRVAGMYPGATVAATNAPVALMVTTTASVPPQVSLSWTAPTTGAAVAYRVERKGVGSTDYAVVQNVTGGATTYTDTSVGGGAAYLYRVRAVDANGNASPASNVALAAAVTFADDPLVSGVTTIQAQHLTQLRQAVNAVRQLAGLGNATWAEAVVSGGLIRAAHVQELRDRLAEALAALNLPATVYTDTILATGAAGTTVKREHVAELRAGASRLMGAAVSGTTTTAAVVAVDGWSDLSFDPATNRINSAGWEYDAAGNQTRTQVSAATWQRHEYDAANRLVRVKTDAGATLASYAYGDTNQRLISEEGGLRTYYAAEGGQTLAEYVEVGTQSVPQWAKSYVYLGARLLATSTPGMSAELVQYQHPDRLGTRLVTNAADTSSFEQATLPFGTPLASESSGATNRRFTSYERSSVTGLDYAANRQYDSQQGRFTQIDPLGMSAVSLDHPQTFNLYTYCANDPVNRADPDGLLFGFLKKLFHSIGRIFSAVGNAIARVLNNRWVQLGVMIAGFIVPFLGPGLAGLAKVIKLGLKIYDTISNIASTLQLYGLLLQGKLSEFGRAVGAGILSAAIATLEDGIIQGVQDAIKKKGFSLRAVLSGAGSGLISGYKKLQHNLLERGIQSLVPFYGNFCSPGNVDSTATPSVDAIDALCKVHDSVYQGKGPKGVSRFDADKTLFAGLFINTAKAHLTDRLVNLAFGTRISGGDIYRSLAIPAFGGVIVYRKITGRGTHYP